MAAAEFRVDVESIEHNWNLDSFSLKKCEYRNKILGTIVQFRCCTSTLSFFGIHYHAYKFCGPEFSLNIKHVKFYVSISFPNNFQDDRR